VPNNLGAPGHMQGPVMVHGVPVEDDVEQLQIELQVVQSRLHSYASCIGGYTFESYEYTLKREASNCSAGD
jgi:hypothetical protein